MSERSLTQLLILILLVFSKANTVQLRGNVALARNLHNRHLNARYTKLHYSRVTIEGITRESLLT